MQARTNSWGQVLVVLYFILFSPSLFSAELGAEQTALAENVKAKIQASGVQVQSISIRPIHGDAITVKQLQVVMEVSNQRVAFNMVCEIRGEPVPQSSLVYSISSKAQRAYFIETALPGNQTIQSVVSDLNRELLRKIMSLNDIRGKLRGGTRSAGSYLVGLNADFEALEKNLAKITGLAAVETAVAEESNVFRDMVAPKPKPANPFDDGGKKDSAPLQIDPKIIDKVKPVLDALREKAKVYAEIIATKSAAEIKAYEIQLITDHLKAVEGIQAKVQNIHTYLNSQHFLAKSMETKAMIREVSTGLIGLTHQLMMIGPGHALLTTSSELVVMQRELAGLAKVEKAQYVAHEGTIKALEASIEAAQNRLLFAEAHLISELAETGNRARSPSEIRAEIETLRDLRSHVVEVQTKFRGLNLGKTR